MTEQQDLFEAPSGTVETDVRFRDMLKELAEAVETYDTSTKIHLVDVVKLAHSALAALREIEEPNTTGEADLPARKDA